MKSTHYSGVLVNRKKVIVTDSQLVPINKLLLQVAKLLYVNEQYTLTPVYTQINTDNCLVSFWWCFYIEQMALMSVDANISLSVAFALTLTLMEIISNIYRPLLLSPVSQTKMK
ncbi:hypothetical protein ILYODFUR_020705 [Ilyodon furcidens]|uniref:Uncharacterized protein n=1 Tax=Ilyodon furcidens TaxID=33524 RepID=A0ABV0UU50_9TELE